MLRDYGFDLRENCTLEVAVARLMGWVDGPRPTESPGELGGESAQLAFFSDTRWPSLQDGLERLRLAAREDLERAIDSGEWPVAIAAKRMAVLAADQISVRAQSYLADMTVEVAKGGNSNIRLDAVMTTKKGEPHYVWKTIAGWAVAKYASDLVVFRAAEPESNPARGVEATEPSIATTPFVIEPESQADTVTVEPLNGNESDWKEGRFKRSHLVTLALLLEDFTERVKGKFSHGPDAYEPNMDVIAKELAERWKKKFVRKPASGQGFESIRKRLAEAITAKDEMLRAKR